MALDQLIMSPLFLVVFFAAVKTLEGQPHKLFEVRELPLAIHEDASPCVSMQVLPILSCEHTSRAGGPQEASSSGAYAGAA